MLASLAAVTAIVAPVFALILLGWGAMRVRLLDEKGADGLTVFVFYLAVPALLFGSVARGSLEAQSALTGIAYFAALLVVFAFALGLARVALGAGLAEASTFAMSVCFGNSVLIGIPLVLRAFGPAGEGPLLAIIGFHSLILIPLATVLVELGLARGGVAGSLRATVMAMLRNPVVTSIIVGMAWTAAGLSLPEPVDRLIQMLGAAAGPCALFALGTSLAGFRIAGDLRQALLVTVLKLALLPAAVAACVWFVFRLDATAAAVAITIAALPTGANAFILANKYRLFERRAASAVLISTAIAFVTVSLLLTWLAPPPSG